MPTSVSYPVFAIVTPFESTPAIILARPPVSVRGYLYVRTYSPYLGMCLAASSAAPRPAEAALAPAA